MSRIATIAPGVFFSASEWLPRGRHSLSRQRVQEIQRERLLTAFTELLAANGYWQVTVHDISRRARVSLEAFYAHFPSKTDCASAALVRFSGVICEQMHAASVAGPCVDAVIRKRLAAYYDALDADPVVARAFAVEIDAAGRSIQAASDASLEQFAAALDPGSPHAAQDQSPGLASRLAVAAAVRAMAAVGLRADRAFELETLMEPSLALIRALVPNVQSRCPSAVQ